MCGREWRKFDTPGIRVLCPWMYKKGSMHNTYVRGESKSCMEILTRFKFIIFAEIILLCSHKYTTSILNKSCNYPKQLLLLTAMHMCMYANIICNSSCLYKWNNLSYIWLAKV